LHEEKVNQSTGSGGAPNSDLINICIKEAPQAAPVKKAGKKAAANLH
jgi:hypothetical protein